MYDPGFWNPEGFQAGFTEPYTCTIERLVINKVVANAWDLTLGEPQKATTIHVLGNPKPSRFHGTATEQFFTFPMFVLTGGWLGAWREFRTTDRADAAAGRSRHGVGRRRQRGKLVQKTQNELP